MLGKRSRSVIGRLSELLVSGKRSSLLDRPIDTFLRDRSENSPNPSRNDQSNNNHSNRNFDLGQHGVGLGIVVALEKSLSSSSSSSSAGGGGMVTCSKYFVCSPRGQGRSEPDDGPAEEEEEEEEDYTYVTFHGPRVSFTMVYHNQIKKERSDVRDRDNDGCSDSDVQGFLRSCQRCGKKLHGQDIYMYRGEKGFCSAECRSEQIIMDEWSEQCRSEVPDVWSYSSSSGYTEGQADILDEYPRGSIIRDQSFCQDYL